MAEVVAAAAAAVVVSRVLEEMVEDMEAEEEAEMVGLAEEEDMTTHGMYSKSYTQMELS